MQAGAQGRQRRATKARAPPASATSGPSPYPGPQPPRRSRSRCDRWSRCRGIPHSGLQQHPSRSRSHSPRSVTHRRGGPWCWAAGRKPSLAPTSGAASMMGWSLPELGKRDFLKDVMKVFNHFSSLKRSFLIGPELLKGICTLEMEEVVETYSC